MTEQITESVHPFKNVMDFNKLLNSVIKYPLLKQLAIKSPDVFLVHKPIMNKIKDICIVEFNPQTNNDFMIDKFFGIRFEEFDTVEEIYIRAIELSTTSTRYEIVI